MMAFSATSASSAPLIWAMTTGLSSAWANAIVPMLSVRDIKRRSGTNLFFIYLVPPKEISARVLHLTLVPAGEATLY